MFRNFDGTALDLTGGCRRITVDSCLFEQIGGTAVQIGGVAQTDHHPAVPGSNTGDVALVRSEIRASGQFYLGSVGVFAGYVDHVTIADCTIRDLPYSAIAMGWGWGEEDAGGGTYTIPYRYAAPSPAGANRLEGNLITRVMTRLNDGGGIYLLGCMPGSILQHNRIESTGPGMFGGIYLDEGSGYIEVRNNVLRDVPKPFQLNNWRQNRNRTCLFVDNDPPMEP